MKIDIQQNIVNVVHKKYYAVSQILALYGILFSNNCETGFLIMFPIQLSTFLMTLVRKNIISNNMWHIVYGISLTLPYITNYHKIYNDQSNIYISIAFIASRLLFKINKYLNMLIPILAFTYIQHLKTIIKN